MKLTIDEILDLIGETKTADEAAEFLTLRLGNQASEISQDIANIFKSSDNEENFKFWKKVTDIIGKNIDQDSHR